MSTDRHLRVFVSSNVRDLRSERDYLHEHTFRQLRKLCEARGVTWDLVDFLLAITDEDRIEVDILEAALKELQHRSHYVIGLIGGHYGPAPETIPKGLLQRWPCLGEHPGSSRTELEIVCGVLKVEAMHGRGLFYFRDPKSF